MMTAEQTKDITDRFNRSGPALTQEQLEDICEGVSRIAEENWYHLSDPGDESFWREFDEYKAKKERERLERLAAAQ